MLGGCVHKLALYADVILFLTKPETSIHALISIIMLFGSLSGYRINFDKSEALPLGDFWDKSYLPNFPFKWSDSGFTYRGVNISNLNNLFKLNFVFHQKQSAQVASPPHLLDGQNKSN